MSEIRSALGAICAAMVCVSLLAGADASAGVGTQRAKLTAGDAAAGHAFGYSVAISGNTAIVGAWGDSDSGWNTRSAYLFDVPEPATLSLLALGALAMMRRRRG